MVNKAEFWGPGVYVTADGTYQPQVAPGSPTPPQCPVLVQAQIYQGTLHVGSSARLPLPIRGTGRFEVLYCDDKLRVFRSGSTLTVQVREALLDTQ